MADSGNFQSAGSVAFAYPSYKLFQAARFFIVLATEMTADVTLLLTMLGACAMAMLTPTLLKDPPIYDSLRERTVARERARLDRAAAVARERE